MAGGRAEGGGARSQGYSELTTNTYQHMGKFNGISSHRYFITPNMLAGDCHLSCSGMTKVAVSLRNVLV